MKKARLTPAARGDLKAIWLYTATRWNTDQAELYVRALGQVMQLLAGQPQLGRNIDSVRQGYWKFPSASHVIYYRTSAGGIDVMRILHKSMDAERHL